MVRNQWFDFECKTLKHAVNSFSKNNDLNCTASQQHYKLLKNRYRAMTQRKKRQFQNSIREDLEQPCEKMASNNPQDYRKYLDNLGKDISIKFANNISVTSN